MCTPSLHPIGVRRQLWFLLVAGASCGGILTAAACVWETDDCAAPECGGDRRELEMVEARWSGGMVCRAQGPPTQTAPGEALSGGATAPSKNPVSVGARALQRFDEDGSAENRNWIMG